LFRSEPTDSCNDKNGSSYRAHSSQRHHHVSILPVQVQRKPLSTTDVYTCERDGLYGATPVEPTSRKLTL
jgi:hypothetical protein